MVSSKAWYEIDKTDEIDSPALIIYRNRVEHNIMKMIGIAGRPEKLMPHIKTYKMKEIVKLQMKAGIEKFKCATIAEAELLGLAGAKQALLAYQPSEVKLGRLLRLIQNYPLTRFSTILDNKESAIMMARVLRGSEIILDVYLDINNGNNRTGIHPQKAYDLYKYCHEQKTINVQGLHIYDGHIRDQDIDVRKKVCDRAFSAVEGLIHSIQTKLNVHPQVIAGGSPTFPVHALRDEVICSPGTTLLWDAGYGSRFTDMPFIPAAVLISRVISKPNDDLYCLDLGHKSVAAENPIENRVRFLNAEGLIPLGHSEEHLVVKNTRKIDLNIGDVVYGIPYHICPTTALYNEVWVVENNKIIDRWEVLARKRKINF
jgi:D-serine deaminase-like pyridoxal phosphate-dependent protein